MEVRTALRLRGGPQFLGSDHSTIGTSPLRRTFLVERGSGTRGTYSLLASYEFAYFRRDLLFDGLAPAIKPPHDDSSRASTASTSRCFLTSGFAGCLTYDPVATVRLSCHRWFLLMLFKFRSSRRARLPAAGCCCVVNKIFSFQPGVPFFHLHLLYETQMGRADVSELMDVLLNW